MSENKFNYSYSAPPPEERDEIERIKRSYAPVAENKLERLKKLDRRVKRLPVAVAITLGVIGILTFGAGLALVLEFELMAGGIALSLSGCAVMGIAYPVYRAIFERGRKKYSQEIIELSDSLLNGDCRK